MNNMNNMLDTLFGPLTREYCLYYYGFSIFFYVLFVFVTVFSLYSLFTKKFSFGLLLSLFMSCFTYFLAYFTALSHEHCFMLLRSSNKAAHLNFLCKYPIKL